MSKQFELLNKYYNANATDSEKRQLAQLLNSHEIWTDDFDNVWNYSFGEMSKTVDNRVLKAINLATKPKKKCQWNRLMQTVSYAAMFSAIIISFLFWRENKLLTKYADTNIAAAKGQKLDVLLPDGTKVYLNADSKLRYGKKFNGMQRTVELTGEAFFDVAKDAKSPFVVKTGKVQVRALGTAFNVRSYPENDKVITYLSRGNVVVTSASQSLKLIPGEAAVYTLSNAQLSKGKEDARLYTAWMDNEMVFDNEPLPNIIKLLERNYNVKIAIKTPKCRNISYTGTLKNASLQSVLNALQFTSTISYKNKNNVIEIYDD